MTSGPSSGRWRRPLDRAVDWFLLSGNRLAISAGLLVGVAAVVWWTVASGLAPLTERTPVLFLLFVLLSGNITLLAIVVSLSQFVLARHLETPGEVQEALRAVVGYRREVSEVSEEPVVPVTPTGFFLVLFRGIERDVAGLRAREWASEEAELGEEVEALVGDLAGHAARVIRLLEAGEGGLRRALFATLGTNYSRYFHGAYRLRAAYGEELPPAVAADLDRLERRVEQVDVARRYFKTVLIQSELASLSRHLLYIGVPILLVTVVLMLAFTAPDPALPRSVLAVAIPAVVTVGFAPILLLATSILRLATVVQRTAAMYPFTTGEEP